MGESRYKRAERRARRLRKALLGWLSVFLRMVTIIFDREMGKRLERVRQEMGFSQKRMAEHLGLSQSMLCRVEAGKVKFLPMTAEQFITALPEYYHFVLFGGLRIWRKQQKASGNKKLSLKEVLA